MSGATRQLNEISAFLSLLARTLCFKPSSSSWPSDEDNYLDDNIFSRLESGHCLEYMYGITPFIAYAIQETCRLAEYLSRHEVTREPLPEDLLQACEDLGDKLLSWTLHSEDITSIPASTGGEMLTIFKHHANAWHTAALIYYYQRVQGFKPEDMIDEVNRVAEYMHAIEDVKAASKSEQATRMTPMTWPALIASGDAANHEPWRKWWTRVEHYGIANIRRQWDIIQQIWERQDDLADATEHQSWINIFKGMDITLLPI